MAKSQMLTLPDSSVWEPKFPFDLVVAYEDTATRNRALHLYDHLAQQLLDDYDFQCSWWKFEHLTDTALREQAADAAAAANMIILSLRAGAELPAPTLPWMQNWLSRKQSGKSALVALVGSGQNEDCQSSPVVTHLQRIARLARMDFFTHGFDLPTEEFIQARSQIAQRVETVTPVLHQILQPKSFAPRWGINE